MHIFIFLHFEIVIEINPLSSACPSFLPNLSLDQFHIASVLWVASGAFVCLTSASSQPVSTPLSAVHLEFHCRSSVHSLPLTCTCAFSICSITSVQYFSFSPVSFVFLLPASSHPLVSSLLLPWGSAVSGSFSAAKKKKLQAALDLVVLLISYYFLRRQSKKHNCIYIYQHF